MRIVDGKKVAFAEWDTYSSSLLGTPSMGRIAKETGADVVLLLASGKTEADLSDDDIREALGVGINEHRSDRS